MNTRTPSHENLVYISSFPQVSKAETNIRPSVDSRVKWIIVGGYILMMVGVTCIVFGTMGVALPLLGLGIGALGLGAVQTLYGCLKR